MKYLRGLLKSKPFAGYHWVINRLSKILNSLFATLSVALGPPLEAILSADPDTQWKRGRGVFAPWEAGQGLRERPFDLW